MQKNCPNCGAPLDHNKSYCVYCGTPIDNWLLLKPPTITITPHNINTLQCKFIIGREVVDIDSVEGMGYVKELIVRKLADELMNYMDIKISALNPINMTYTVMGRIRVLNESARFTDL